uniref:hypothetical protein n=1 Tax=Klebsiella TaxID=570 RepID=UPI001B3C6C71|nr:hypothetical protein [Klebsiella pneumoniae]WOF71946.1 DNA replication protein [Klebsiella pneumoniae]
MGSCAAPSAKGDDKFITTDYLQQCRQRYRDIIYSCHRRTERRGFRISERGKKVAKAVIDDE